MTLQSLHHSQLPMAFSAAAFLFFCATLLGVRLPIDVYAAAAAGTWAIYLWDAERGARTGEDGTSKPARAALFLRHGRAARAAAWLSALAAAVLALPELRRWSTLWLLLGLLAIGAGYVFQFLPGPAGRLRLKDIAWLKSVWVATAWALGGIALPELFARFHTAPRRVGLWPLAVFSWLLLWMDTLLLDHRDRDADRRHGVRTLAQHERALRAILVGGCLGCLVIALAQPSARGILVAVTASFALAAIYVLQFPTGEMLHAVLIGTWRFVGALLVAFSLGGCQSLRPAGPPVQSAWVEIDVGAFRANVHRLQSVLGPKTGLCAVMKGDAYGHGIRLLMPAVLAEGVKCVAVAGNEEIRAAREAGFRGRLMRIRTATVEEIAGALDDDAEELIGNLAEAREVSRLAAARGRTIRIHLALNSAGMSRNGVDSHADALAILRLPHLETVGLMTHFPREEASDVRRGLRVFLDETDSLIREAGLERARLVRHAANSFAALEVPESRLDLVRAGEALYSGTIGNHTEYRPVMRLKARVAAVNAYRAGSTVSYDRTFRLKRDSRLANLGIGYANGYRREFSNLAEVRIGARRLPVVGRVTMNTLMVDVTDAPEVRAGDEAVLYDGQTIGWPQVGGISGTIPADFLTTLGRSNVRVPVPGRWAVEPAARR